MRNSADRDWTMDEINAEIAEARRERGLRRVDGVLTDKPLDEIVAEKRRRQGPEVEKRRKRSWELIKEQWARNAETLDHDWTLDEVNALIDETRRNRAVREEKANA